MTELLPDPVPWLRFQCYFVGLPKTGSTSLAWLLGNYRTRHEWQMPRLMSLGFARLDGALDDRAFWQSAGPRLSAPRLEFDDTTCNWLYADLLVQHFPAARYVWALRHPVDWAMSIIDMGYRQMEVTRLGVGSREGWLDAMAFYAGGPVDIDVRQRQDSTELIDALLRAWESHMRLVSARIPSDLTTIVRTRRLDSSGQRIAADLRIDPRTLKRGPGPENRAPVRFNHLANCDIDALEDVYLSHCAELVERWLPDESSVSPRFPASDLGHARDWDEYAASTMAWARGAAAGSVGWRPE